MGVFQRRQQNCFSNRPNLLESKQPYDIRVACLKNTASERHGCAISTVSLKPLGFDLLSVWSVQNNFSSAASGTTAAFPAPDYNQRIFILLVRDAAKQAGPGAFLVGGELG